jgi:hypothetical protein
VKVPQLDEIIPKTHSNKRDAPTAAPGPEKDALPNQFFGSAFGSAFGVIEWMIISHSTTVNRGQL